jgi:hypothetical protein
MKHLSPSYGMTTECPKLADPKPISYPIPITRSMWPQVQRRKGFKAENYLIVDQDEHEASPSSPPAHEPARPTS